MKLALEYDVEGTIHVAPGCKVANEDLECLFVSDQEGVLKAVRMVARVPDPAKITSSIGPGTGDSKATITFPLPDEVHRWLINTFQNLESYMAFFSNGAFRGFAWQKPRHELLPETEQEMKDVSITAFAVSWDFPLPRFELTATGAASLVRRATTAGDLGVLCSFWREAMNAYRDFKFINAFNGFYRVVEGLYGDGKTRNKDVLARFKQSARLRASVDRRIDDLRREVKHREAIVRLFGGDSFMSSEGMMEDLLGLRARTHHYSRSADKIYASPLDHDDYRSVAWICMGLATDGIFLAVADESVAQGGNRAAKTGERDIP